MTTPRRPLPPGKLAQLAEEREIRERNRALLPDRPGRVALSEFRRRMGTIYRDALVNDRENPV